MITRLKIEGLFGRFDYDLDFKNPVTILTGPNGFGKSTVLRMIEALGSGNLEFFTDIVFSSIIVWFDNSEKVEIKNKNDYIVLDDFEIPKSYFDNRIAWIKTIEPHKSKSEIMNMPLNQVDSHIISKGRIFTEKELIKETIKSFREKMGSLCGNIVIISEQRLIDIKEDEEGNQTVTEVILEKPNEMKREIDDAYGAFAQKTGEVESNYLQRLFLSEEITEEQYHQFYRRANEKFEKMEKYHLMEERLPDVKQIPKFEPKHAAALKVFFDTFFEKYAVYDSFFEKFHLFTDILNEHIFFKKLIISSGKGFEIIDEVTGKSLALGKLSSGEKHVIVMYYNLIFNDNENLLLLIDEPEISLHIAWQKQFMDDIFRIVKLKKANAIVATHSPYVIGNHWESQIDLGEQYQDELYGEDVGESYGD